VSVLGARQPGAISQVAEGAVLPDCTHQVKFALIHRVVGVESTDCWLKD